MTFLKSSQHLGHERQSSNIEEKRRVGRKRRKGGLDPALSDNQILMEGLRRVESTSFPSTAQQEVSFS